MHLLESLATVQSIVLVCDVPQSDELIIEIFQTLFGVVSTELSQNFLLLFADLSVQIINGTAPIIPPPVVKLLLDQFKSKQLKSNPASYRLAIDICNACEDRLKQDVCRYFNDCLTQASKAAGFTQLESDDSENDQSEDYDTRKGFAELEDTHSLIKSVYQVCPGLLQSVVPQLEAELKKSHVQIRLLAVQTLGQMFAEQSFGSLASSQALKSLSLNNPSSLNQSTFYSHQSLGIDLARRYSSTWKEWMRKSCDVSSQIRSAVMRCLKNIISTQPHLNHDISLLFKARLIDPDEKVRCECCKVFSQLDFELVLHHIDVSVLKALCCRIEDRKASVQREALNALGRLYHQAHAGIDADNPKALIQFSWIPQEFLFSMFARDARLCASVEKTFLDLVTPLPSSVSDEGIWVDRLINVVKHLDQTGVKRLRKFSRLGIRRPTGFDRFLEGCEEYNGGVMNQDEAKIKTRLAHTIRMVSSHFPDALKAREDLHSLAKMNDRRIYRLLKILSNDKIDLSAFLKALHEFRRKIKDLSTSLAETLEIFLHKSAYLVINSAVVPVLLERIQADLDVDTYTEPEDSFSNFSRTTVDAAKVLLDMISTSRPTMLQAHLSKIVECLSKVSGPNKNPSLADACLLALKSMAKHDATAIPSDQALVSPMKYFVMDGTASQAKLAAVVLAKVRGMESACRDMTETLVSTLRESSPGRVASSLSALAQIVKYAPQIFESYATIVTPFVIHNQIYTSSVGEQEGDDDWIPDPTLCDSSKARIEGLKILINRCIANAELPTNNIISPPIFKLLWQLMVLYEKIASATHSYAVAARFRLKAVEATLKFASYPSLRKDVYKNFRALVLFSQDTCESVREGFYKKLIKYLTTRQLCHPRFNVILFLSALDSSKYIRDSVSLSIRQRLKVVDPQTRTTMFETSIIYLLHTLSHHKQFGTEIRDLENMAICIDFFVDCVGNCENASLLYHLAGQLKTVKDTDPVTHSEALYFLSELAQLVIRTRAREHHWSLPTYPGEVKLPSELFESLPPGHAAEVARKDYLPDEFVKSFSVSRIHAIAKEKRSGVEEDQPETHQTKRLVKPNKARATTKKKRRLSDEEDNHDGQDDPNNIEDSEMRNIARQDLRPQRPPTRRRNPKRGPQKSDGAAHSTDIDDDG